MFKQFQNVELFPLLLCQSRVLKSFNPFISLTDKNDLELVTQKKNFSPPYLT